MRTTAANRVLRRVKTGIPDVTGTRTRQFIVDSLHIDPGAVRSGKLFTVLLPLSREDLADFARSGLCEPPLHEFALQGEAGYAGPEGFSRVVVVARHPGVTDDEGASAQRVLRDLFPSLRYPAGQAVFSQDVFWFERPLASGELDAICAGVLGNPLINRFWHGSDLSGFDYVPDVAIPASSVAEPVSLDRSLADLVALSGERLWAFSPDELAAIKAHFDAGSTRAARTVAGMDAEPTDCEMEIIAQTWSEHCKHKEFAALVEVTDLATGGKTTVDSLFRTYIKGATDRVRADLEAAGEDWIVKVFSDNAGMVRIDERRLFAFKVETHNSPSALDPYGGSLTGIVGVNRDPMGTGRGGARLVFNTDVLCFARPDYSGPLYPGQLHPARIMAGVVKGIEDGGNKSGIPTVNGAVVFDDRYRGKPLVYCGTGAIIPTDRAPGSWPVWDKPVRAGDRIYMAGGRVGRDGIHGATFSSGKLDEKSPRTAVQIGSPIVQKLMDDFLRKACDEDLVVSLTDNGAGGLSSSVGELAREAVPAGAAAAGAAPAGTPAAARGGAVVNLERVPLKYPGLRPWEIFVSESQERMTLCVDPAKAAALEALARRYEVELTDIGAFTDSGFLDVRYGDRRVAWLDLAFLHDGLPRKRMEAEWDSRLGGGAANASASGRDAAASGRGIAASAFAAAPSGQSAGASVRGAAASGHSAAASTPNAAASGDSAAASTPGAAASGNSAAASGGSAAASGAAPADAGSGALPEVRDWNGTLRALLARPNIASKEGIIRRYDHEVKGRTVLKPLAGATGTAPQDAGVVRIDLEGWAGIAVSNGILPRYADRDPYASSAGAFDEAVRQIVSVGGELPTLGLGGEPGFWSVNDNFCVPDSAYDPVGNPDGKRKLGALVRMCQALYDASTAYRIPLTSGKDSMKNDFRAGEVKISVPPTVLYSAAAKIEDVRRIVTAEFKQPGDVIYLVGPTYEELGCSEFAALAGFDGGTVPQVRFDEARSTYVKMMKAHRRGYLASSHDCSDGGLAVALAECCFGGASPGGAAGGPPAADFLGAAVDLETVWLDPRVTLFSESHSRFVVSVPAGKLAVFENLMEGTAVRLGLVTGAGRLVVDLGGAPLLDEAVADLRASWQAGPGGASW